MLVVADSSPLVALIAIGQIELLPRLFEHVVVPPAVFEELTNSHRADELRAWTSRPPAWLEIHAPVAARHYPALHPGESQAICLALELKADLLLIDERDGYKMARSLGLNAVGTIAVLEHAAESKLIDLRDAFESLKRTDFWISHRLLDARLAAFRSRSPN